jgi:hypothetical protein
MKNNSKVTIYYIEYHNTIKFFQGSNSFDMIKNEQTRQQFNRIKNRYTFIDLLAR